MSIVGLAGGVSVIVGASKSGWLVITLRRAPFAPRPVVGAQSTLCAEEVATVLIWKKVRLIFF
jgi:hypothetical protein